MSRLTTGAALAALLLATTTSPAATLRVDASLASGANDGSSWEDAFQGTLGLQNALAAAVSGDQIWIAGGTYLPAIGAPRSASFFLKTGVEIYGGFAGGETRLSERDPAANVVTLSGDLAGNDPVLSDNAYHVVQGGSANATALLSGVTVRAGFSNGAGNFNRGGGLYIVSGARPRIEDSIVRDNRCVFGGGACYIANASPSFTRVRFESNIGGSFGGAFDIFSSGVGSDIEFEACRFIGNSAARAGGVEVFGTNATATLVNCLFLANTATGNGGAMYVASNGSTTLKGCTVVGNSTTGNTGGLHLTGQPSVVHNTIVWHNTDGDGGFSQILGGSTAIKYCNIEGGWAGAGTDTIDAAPLFADMASGDVNLLDGSPGIDAGSNSLVPAGTDSDLDGGPRFVDDPCADDRGAGGAPVVDMGAQERDDSCKTTCVGDTDGSGAVDFTDLLTVLSAWGPCPGCPADLDGDDTVGFTDLLVVLSAWGPCP
ncbi:MAG: right-handed parallel beta-helix repeat-containing protein [Phycisphaerales bacterium]|nr:right-handed parallel beta-helix repeat-containing protein [Phycisphaerales bacterium]NNM25116.1 right-handed parallel beta-helix repeat-containing protein [Phycisphaerales bacterium]